VRLGVEASEGNSIVGDEMEDIVDSPLSAPGEERLRPVYGWVDRIGHPHWAFA
jgi:hypothetical protein